ncbi:MAG TPA: hypothetical protein VKT70_16370 [Stellaceae bacterium]|nr:hypothetical protein [Stellaceae bacterium]
MVMTSGELKQTLQTLEELIAAVERRGPPLDSDQSRALRQLRERRSSLSVLLKVRRHEATKKVVSLDLWRYGHCESGEGARRGTG